ncbi:MAG: hypothetical protein QW743_08760 [Candidatus Methanomethylicia archaeon]
MKKVLKGITTPSEEEINKTITTIIQTMQRNRQNLIVSPNKDSNSIVIFSDEATYKDIENIISQLDKYLY